MKRQRILKITGFFIFLFLLMAEGVLICRIRAYSQRNVTTVGRVEITLREPAYEAGQEEETETRAQMLFENVKPGQDILRDPTIYVAEESRMAYLRTRIIVRGLTEYQKQDLLEAIELQEGWRYNSEDGYYYYSSPVTGGAVVPFFQEIHIPDEWENAKKQLCFQVSVMAEAVESSYLTPNLSADCQMIGWIPTKQLEEVRSGLPF